MDVSLDDPSTIEAIRILADVLDDVAGPDQLECLMASNALRNVVDTRSETALGFARQAFESLDPGVRVKVRSDATDAAIKVIEQKKRERRVSTQRLTRTPAKSTGSPILDAMNSGGNMRTERKW